MIYSIFIDGFDYTNKISTGFSTVERLDETLDSGLLVLPFTDIDTEFNRYSKVYISILDTFQNIKNFDYLISSDKVEIMSKDDINSSNGIIYQHTITLVESTKKIENFLSSTLTFTQPTDGTVRYTLFDVIDRINKLNPIEQFLDLNSTRLFTIPTDIENELKLIDAPQLFFKGLTVREGINNALKYYSSICRLDNNYTLSLDKFNDLKDLITTSNLLDENRQEDVSSYAVSLRTENENVVTNNSTPDTITFPNNSNWELPKGENVVIVDDNLKLIMNRNIYTIQDVSLIVNGVDYEDSDTGETVNDADFVLNITHRTLEKQNWNELDSDAADYATTDDLYKSTTLYYTFQDNKIENMTEAYGIWGANYVIENIVENELPKLDQKVKAGTVDWTPVYGNYAFRVNYTPFYNVRFDEERNDIDNINKASQLNNNQNDRIVSLEQFSNNMYGKIQRIGTEELELSNRVDNLSELYELGDYTSDNYVIATREFFYYSDYILAKYQLTKNFNRLSQFIGLDAEYRSYDISEPRQTLERIDLYKEFIEVGFNSSSTNDSFADSNAVDTFLNTFKSGVENQSVTTALTFFYDDDVNRINTNDTTIVTDVVSIGGKNSLMFTFGFNSNVVAGNQSSINNFKDVLKPVKYVDDKGFFKYFKFKLVSGLIQPTSVEEAFDNSRDYPLLVFDDIFDDSKEQFSTDLFYIDKDSSEIYKFTYQVQILPEKDEKDDIVIGRELSNNNLLTTSQKSVAKFLRVYGVNQSIFDDINPQGTALATSPQLPNSIVDSVNKTLDLRSSSLDYMFNTPNAISWSIVDINNNVYISCNDINERVISFNWKNKRSGIDYEW